MIFTMPYKPNLRQPYPNELYHHGIKGQKWGVRRFQNADGTLTSAGKKRYNSGQFQKLDEDLSPSAVKRYVALHGKSLMKAMAKELKGEGNSGLSEDALTKIMFTKEGLLSTNPVGRRAEYLYHKRLIDEGRMEPKDPDFDWASVLNYA